MRQFLGKIFRKYFLENLNHKEYWSVSEETTRNLPMEFAWMAEGKERKKKKKEEVDCKERNISSIYKGKKAVKWHDWPLHEGRGELKEVVWK